MSIEPNRVVSRWRWCSVAMALLGSGCLELQTAEPKTDRTCTACHGDERRAGDLASRAAPPLDLNGNRATAAKGVGAHERHLSKNGHAAVACSACHVVPETVFSPGHVDSEAPAEVVLGGLAVAPIGDPAATPQPQRQPTYDGNSGGCTDTYCHRGATVNWTAARSAETACGTCHGLPPALPHPQKQQCSNCHGDVIGADGHWVAPERHVNGIVDVKIQGKCSACHGTNAETGAPPPDLAGVLEPSARGVGAHANHLSDTATHRAVACSECHRVPTAVDSPGHIDSDGRAEIFFGPLATAKQSPATYAADPVRCNNTYCHGVSTGNWQAPRNSDAACGSCHSLPPALPHTQLTQCSSCHARVVDANRKIIEPSLHVNGTVEVDHGTDCAGCHGTGVHGAPPPDLHGNVAVAARGVGAHAAHVAAGTTHAALACSECHRVPVSVDDPSHIDGDDVAEVTFGPLAATAGHQPTYDKVNAACNNNYCHRGAEPAWQAPRSSEAACGSCHALPPPAPHPVGADCSKCHAAVVDAARHFVAPELHVNGRVDLSAMSCNACHGTAASGAPPPDSAGNSNSSARGVGAHAVHVDAAATHGSVACNECHVVPLAWDSPGHRDSPLPAEVTFGSLAKTNGAVPSYSATELTCSASYCHGKALPNWTQPRSSSAACGSCHGLPPPAPHPQKADCSQCHGAVVDASRNFVAPALHVNGTIDVVPMRCNSCHGTDSTGAPPPDNAGNTDPSQRGVGAHANHLQASATHAAVACNECHLVPSAPDAIGHLDSPLPAEVTFGALASANGAKPSYSPATLTCAASYCHGAAVPQWTAPRTAEQACGSCHGLPPPAPHPQNSACSLCHGDVIDTQRTFLHPERHVDGQLQVVQNCTACHGNSTNAAPPTDVSGSADPARIGVGAHQLHLSGGNYSRALACADCHIVPTTIEAPGHLDVGPSTPADVVIGGPGAAEGRNPQWDRTSTTCSGSWCHGPLDPQNSSPRWSATPGSLTCTSCHGMPPPAPHSAETQCQLCHANVDAQKQIIDRSLHVNGEIDFF